MAKGKKGNKLNFESNILQNQAPKEGRETLDWLLYDSLLLNTASGVNRLTFFQQTMAVGKQLTNMKNAGQLPSPQVMHVTEMKFRFYNPLGTSFFGAGAGVGAVTNYPLNVMIATGFFRLTLEPSQQYEGHLSQASVATHALYNTNAALLSTAMIPNMLSYFSIKFKKPIVIMPARHFEVYCELTTPAAGGGYPNATTRLMWMLKGVLRRNS